MNTHPDFLDERSALGWRPFGAVRPQPRGAASGERWTPRAADDAPQHRAAAIPLWLPMAVAVALGVVIWLAALVARGPVVTAPDQGQVAPIAVTSAIALAGSSPLAAPAPAADGERYAAAPTHIGRRPHAPRRAAPAVFAPERVSDLKANPFVAVAPRAPVAPRAWQPRRVSDLKANPYR